MVGVQVPRNRTERRPHLLRWRRDEDRAARPPSGDPSPTGSRPTISLAAGRARYHDRHLAREAAPIGSMREQILTLLAAQADELHA